MYERAEKTFREMEQERRSGKSVMNKKEQKLKKEEEKQRGENYKKGARRINESRKNVRGPLPAGFPLATNEIK